MTEDELVGWLHQLSRHEFERSPGDSEGQEVQSMGLQRVRHSLATKQQQPQSLGVPEEENVENGHEAIFKEMTPWKRP